MPYVENFSTFFVYANINFITGSSNYKLSNVRVHDRSDGHSKAMEAKIAKLQPHSTPLGVIQRRLTSEQHEKFHILFNTAYCEAKQNLSFCDFPMLCQLQAKNGLQIGQNYQNNRGTKEFIARIA